VLVLFIHVNFYHFVPSCSYDRVVVARVPDIRYLSLLWIVGVQLKSVNSRKDVKDLNVSLV
jgi:hypothetical protein